MIDFSSFIKYLNLPCRILVGIFLASFFTMENEGFNFQDLGPAADEILALIATYSGILALICTIGTGCDFVWRHLMSYASKSEFDKEQRTNEAAVLGRIKYLAKGELIYLLDALRSSTQSFCADIGNPSIGSLIQKTLIQPSLGSYNEYHYPFTIPDYVWKFLIENKNELLSSDNNDQP